MFFVQTCSLAALLSTIQTDYIFIDPINSLLEAHLAVTSSHSTGWYEPTKKPLGPSGCFGSF